MIKIVLGCPGIGKVSLSKKNDYFFDLKKRIKNDRILFTTNT